MGWADGSYLMNTVWKEVHQYIPKEKKKKIARKILKMLEDRDCDTIYECRQLLKDAERNADE